MPVPRTGYKASLVLINETLRERDILELFRNQIKKPIQQHTDGNNLINKCVQLICWNLLFYSESI